MPTDTHHHRNAVTRGSAPAPEDGQIRVLLVDDHPAVRLGTHVLIDSQPDMIVVGQAANADDALRQAACVVDVALVDYQLGDGEDGLWLTVQLKHSESPPRVLVYSAFADGPLAVMASIAGADGLLDKRELGGELCWAIRRLARGQDNLPAVSPPIARAMRSRVEPRDQALFGMLLQRLAPEVIADSLAIGREELEAGRARILRRFKPARPIGAHAPLDYARAQRAMSHRRVA